MAKRAYEGMPAYEAGYKDGQNDLMFRQEKERDKRRESILEKGYKEYRPGPFDSSGIIMKYQKRFRDEKGTKYFIDIHEYDGFYHPTTGDYFPGNYEYFVQMYSVEKHEPINMLFFAGWDIESVEEKVEAMFDTGLFDYYEEESE